MNNLHISGVCYESIADAIGTATTIFFSGCYHHCKGCHSQQTWDFNYGQEVSNEMINTIREEIIKRPFVKTIVLSGGDPFYSAKAINAFLDKLNLPTYTIWVYTGFKLEELENTIDAYIHMLLDRCDYLVDGEFEIDNRDITLNFRGSSNQQIYHRNAYGLWDNVTNEI